MWDLFGWPLLGAVIAVLVGVGFSLMSTTPPEFEAAKWCFHAAAIILALKTAPWLADQRQSEIVLRTVVAFFLFGGIGTAWLVSFQWVQGRQRGREAEQSKPSEVKEPAVAQARLRIIGFEPAPLVLGQPAIIYMGIRNDGSDTLTIKGAYKSGL